MNRLTDRNKEIQLPCTGNGVFWARVHEKLARYEDSGLEPEEVDACKLALMGKSLAEVKEIEGISVERMKELAKAEAEGRLVVLDREAALAIAAGWRAIRTTKSFHDASFVYDPLGEDGGPYEIPYVKAGEILCNIWDKYPLEGEDAEKALEEMKNDER